MNFQHISITLWDWAKKYPNYFYIFKWLFFSSIIGVVVGTSSALFLFTLDWVTHLRENNIWLIAFLPIGGLLIGCLYFYLGQDVEKGSKILFEVFGKDPKVIPVKMAPFIFFGTLTTHLLGGSAGREGTALQMAGALCDQLSAPFRLTLNDRKILMIAAIAAGFGSVFGTPLAGAVFAMEVVVIGKFQYKAIFPAFFASLFADTVTDLWQIHHTQYLINIIPVFSVNTLVLTIIAGIACGICAWVFCKFIHLIEELFKSIIKFPPFRPLVGGVIVVVAILCVGKDYIGLGIPFIVESFDQSAPFYTFCLKMVFTVITLGSGFKGGEVTPLFFIGATLGSTLACFIHLPTALLAGIGFVAVFAGATKTPLACIILSIELFGLQSASFMAVACLVSYIFSGRDSIYHKSKKHKLLIKF